jgi:hypothetical protein
VFFLALVILDPLVIVLVATVRRAGVALAAAVMAADATANWITNLSSLHVQLAGLALITAVCVINSPSGRPPSPGTAVRRSRCR